MWLIPPSMSSVFAPAQRCSMREFASLCPRRGLWVTSSGKPSLRAFSWRGWLTRRWIQHLFGADLLKISSSGSGVEQWTASLRASRASRGAPPESNRESPTTDGSGQPSATGSAPQKSLSFSLRMCQGSLLDEESIAYSEILPRSGSMRSGVLYPQPMWEPPIFANEFSFWPSTRAEDAESCGNHPSEGSHNGDSLTGVTRLWMTLFGFSAGNGPDGNEFSTQVRLWQTPTEDNANNNGGPSRSRPDGFADLTAAVNLFPTPRTTGLDGGSHSREAAKARGAWPTAGANDHKGSAKVGQRRGQLDEAAEQMFSTPNPIDGDYPRFSHLVLQTRDGQPSSPNVPGSRRRLNPAFAAWLMGMPWWWTSTERISSAQSEMESWRSRLESRLRFLLGDFSR